MKWCAVRDDAVTVLQWGFGPTPFGRALVAWSPTGICHLAFATGTDTAMRVACERSWPGDSRSRDDGAAADLLARAFGRPTDTADLRLALRGTAFQLQVWQALLDTHRGEVLTYGELARRIGAPRAARAVGSALAANEIGWLIPCHRVVREGGDIGQYRWLPERKAAMLGWEAQARGIG